MKTANDVKGYGWVSRFFHWLIAALILSVIGIGLYTGGLPHETQEQIQRVFDMLSAHKTIGIAALFLAILRIMWSFTQIKPRPLHPERRLETWLAESVHWGLYIGMVVMPLSGWLLHASAPGAFSRILWPFGQRLPGLPESAELSKGFAQFHVIGWWVLAALILLHVAGALKHALIDRDATLARMAGKSASLAEPPVAPPHHRLSAVLAAIGGLTIWAAVALLAPLAAQEETPAPAPTATTAATGPATETAVPTTANAWQVESGNLRIAVDQGGSAVEGAFSDWHAVIDYDPESRTGHVEVTIAITSLTLGSVGDSAKGPEFLNAAQFPEARFVADIQPPASADGPHVAKGTLTIAGVALPAELPFALTIDGDQAAASGEMSVDRRDFGLGKSYADESTVGFPVVIRFDLVAKRP